MKNRDVLKEIVSKKKERIPLAKIVLSEEAIKEKIGQLPPTRSFSKAIVRPRQISLIAEIKKSSPSLGVIRADFNHIEIAKVYHDAGVNAVSVLTEEDFFSGNISFLNEVKSVTQVPVLRKDFIIDLYQVYESRYYGADALLLIAGLLTQDQISEFSSIALGLGMETVVEVHDEKELKKVLRLKNIPIIGINNRSLRSLDVDSKTTEKLFPLVPREKIVIVESGISSPQDILFLKILGVNAVLVGTVFMKADNIRAKIDELMGW